MVKRWNRLLVAFFVLTDSLFGMIAFVLAYVLRFDAGLIEAPKGYPPFTQYFNVLPLIGLLRGLPFDPMVARAHAEAFSRQRFAAEMASLIDQTREAPAGARW